MLPLALDAAAGLSVASPLALPDLQPGCSASLLLFLRPQDLRSALPDPFGSGAVATSDDVALHQPPPEQSDAALTEVPTAITVTAVVRFTTRRRCALSVRNALEIPVCPPLVADIHFASLGPTPLPVYIRAAGASAMVAAGAEALGAHWPLLARVSLAASSRHALQLDGVEMKPDATAAELTFAGDGDANGGSVYLCPGDSVSSVYQLSPRPWLQHHGGAAAAGLQSLGCLQLSWRRRHPSVGLGIAQPMHDAALQTAAVCAVTEWAVCEGSISSCPSAIAALAWVQRAVVLTTVALPEVLLLPPQLSVALLAPPWGVVGEPVAYGVLVRNHTPDTQSVGVAVAGSDAFLCSGRTSGRLALPPGGAHTVWFSLLPVLAGRLPLPLSSVDAPQLGGAALHPDDNKAIFIHAVAPEKVVGVALTAAAYEGKVERVD